MDQDDRQKKADEDRAESEYEAPRAEQVDSTEGPAVTSAGNTIPPA
jgi:hypothetical protein